MKKFIWKVVAFFLIIALIFIPFNVILDPYNVFHPDHLVNNGVEPNKNYIKCRNVLKNPDKFDSFLFGSSRVGFMDVTRMNDGTYYDMMYSEGLPAEHLENLKTFIDKGIIPKNVVIGLDDITYFVDPSLHDDILYRAPFPWSGSVFDKAGFYMKYFDLLTTVKSIETIKEHDAWDTGFSERLLNRGTENLDIESQFDAANNKPYWADYYMPREEVFDEIQEIIDLCNENNIHLTFFTNPLFGYTYTQGIENGYLVFLDRLADITDYYNFSGYNNLTLDSSNYYENSHYTRVVGDKMIDVLFYDQNDQELLEQGFGYHVTKDNKEELLTILNNQAINFGIEVNSYKDTLNKPVEEE
ncbi:MAG: hypothetical protein PHY47_02000 [Lachnospiraceae bacterium]|nr:hypothetical protein [Lachnospiraceae bacterium]